MTETNETLRRILSNLNSQINVSKELELMKTGYLDSKNASPPLRDKLERYTTSSFTSGPVAKRATLGGWG